MSVLLATVVLTGGIAGCGADAPKTPAQKPTDVPKPKQLVTAPFAAPAATGTQPSAVTYDAALVPTTGTATVAADRIQNKTVVTLRVTGLQADHAYGAHVHTKQCGPQPADSGPHYQDKKDPVTPSIDPAYANAMNEIWLDFMTDADGNARVTSSVSWSFRPGEANSVVIHAMHTATEQGKAGTAGNRLACITAAFGR